MPLESGTYISDLVVTNPPGTDPKSAMDDHLRLIKSTIKNTFPNITGPVTKTQAELNSVTDRGLTAGQTWTGAHQFPATTYGVTAAFGASGTAYATLDFVNSVAISVALPGQAGNAFKFLQTNGIIESWSEKLDDSTIRFSNNADPTKKVAFSLSGLTTATTRTVTIPDKSGTMAMTSDFPQYLVSTSQLDKTNDTTLADIPGLSATLVSGATYRFTLIAYTTSVNNGGVNFGFSGTATATSFVAAGFWQLVGGPSTFRTTSLAVPIGSLQAVGLINTVEGTIACNVGGTFKIQFAQAASFGTTSSVLINSTLTVQRIS